MARRSVIIAFSVLATALIIFFAAGSQPVLRAIVNLSGYELVGGSLSGNLFTGLRASDTTVRGPGVDARVSRAVLRADLFGLFVGSLPLTLDLQGAGIRIDPAKFPKGAGAGGPISLRLDGLNLKSVTLRIAGRTLEIPDVRVTVRSQTPATGRGLNGKLLLDLNTPSGGGKASLNYGLPNAPSASGLAIEGRATLDVSMAQHYWSGLRGGAITLRGHYANGALQLSAVVQGGSIHVVQGFDITGIRGAASMDESLKIMAHLTGETLNGSLQASGVVDLKAQHFVAGGSGTAGVHAGLGIIGARFPSSGRLVATVTASGWRRFAIDATLAGAGKASSFTLAPLTGAVRYDSEAGAFTRWEAVTRIGIEPQRLDVRTHTVAGRTTMLARSNGRLAGYPFSLNSAGAVLSGVLTANINSKILSGYAVAKVRYANERLSGSGEFSGARIAGLPGSASGRLSARGEIATPVFTAKVVRSAWRLPGLKTGPLTGQLTARFLKEGPVALSGNLDALSLSGTADSGQVTLRPVPTLGGGLASSELSYARAFTRWSGTVTLQAVGATGFRIPLVNAAVRVNVQGGTVASVTSPTFNLRYANGEATGRLTGLPVAVLGATGALNGNLAYGRANVLPTGRLSLASPAGTLIATSDGKQVAVSGALALGQLRADTHLNARIQGGRVSADGSIRALGQPLSAVFRVSNTSPFIGQVALRSGSRPSILNASVTGDALNASGNLDLSALQAWAPGLSGLIGVSADQRVVRVTGALASPLGRYPVKATLAASSTLAEMLAGHGRAAFTATAAGLRLSGEGDLGAATLRVDGRVNPLLAAFAPVRLVDDALQLTGAYGATGLHARGLLGRADLSATLDTQDARAVLSGQATLAFLGANRATATIGGLDIATAGGVHVTALVRSASAAGAVLSSPGLPVSATSGPKGWTATADGGALIARAGSRLPVKLRLQANFGRDANLTAALNGAAAGSRPWGLKASGPLEAVTIAGTLPAGALGLIAPGLPADINPISVSGTANLLGGRGRLSADTTWRGYTLKGQATLKGALTAGLTAGDKQGGTLSFKLDASGRLVAAGRQFNLQPAFGAAVNLDSLALNTDTRQGALPDGRFRMNVAGTTVTGTWSHGAFHAASATPAGAAVLDGPWVFPMPGQALRFKLSGPAVRANANVNLVTQSLTGQLELGERSYKVNASAATQPMIDVSTTAERMQLASGRWTGGLPLTFTVFNERQTAHVSLHGPVADPTMNLTASGPVSGRISGRLAALAGQVSVTPRKILATAGAALQVTANALTGNASAAGNVTLQGESYPMKARYAAGRAEATFSGPVLRGLLAWTSATGFVNGRLTASGLNLAPFANLVRPGLLASGRGSVTAELTGTAQRPAVKLTALQANANIPGIGEIVATGALNYSSGVLNGNVEADAIGIRAALDGQVNVGGSLSAQASVNLRRGSDVLAGQARLSPGGLHAVLSGQALGAPLELKADGPLSAVKVSATADLAPLKRDLDVTPGRVTAQGAVNLLALSGSASIAVTGARVSGLGVSASGSVVAGGGAWSSNAVVGLGGVESRIFAGSQGLRVDPLDLDLRVLRVLGLDVAGRVHGSVAAPSLGLSSLSGRVSLVGVKAYGLGVSGSASAVGGLVTLDANADSGLGAGRVSGSVWPRVNLVGSLAEARLNVSGEWSSPLTVTAGGRVFNQPLSGVVALNAGSLSGGLQAGVGSLNVKGPLGNLSLALSSLDLSSVAGVPLVASGDARLTGGRLAGVFSGAVAGGAWRGAARFDSAGLQVSDFVVRDAFGLTGQLMAGGNVTPNLNLTGRLSGSLAGQDVTATLGASGSLAVPKLSVGALASGVGLGLDAAWNARDGMTARLSELPGGRFTVAGVSGRVSGGLTFDPHGFGGRLAASGQVAGNPVSLTVIGSGGLQATLFGANGGRAQASAPLGSVVRELHNLGLSGLITALPSDEARASLDVQRLDLGSLVGAPGIGRLSLKGDLIGGLRAPRAHMTGRLELGGTALPLSLNADPSAVSLTASGAAAGVARLDLKTGLLSGRLALRDLKPGALAGLTGLTLDGRLDLSGTSGAPVVSFSNLSARAASSVGAVSVALNGAFGGASRGVQLEGSVSGGALDGSRAAGSLAWLAGDLDANLNTRLSLAGSQFSASGPVRVSGRGGNLDASGVFTLAGAAGGVVNVGGRDLFGAGGPTLSVNGALQAFGAPILVNLSGAYPRLSGQVRVRKLALDGQDGAFTLRGRLDDLSAGLRGPVDGRVSLLGALNAPGVALTSSSTPEVAGWSVGALQANAGWSIGRPWQVKLTLPKGGGTLHGPVGAPVAGSVHGALAYSPSGFTGSLNGHGQAFGQPLELQLHGAGGLNVNLKALGGTVSLTSPQELLPARIELTDLDAGLLVGRQVAGRLNLKGSMEGADGLGVHLAGTVALLGETVPVTAAVQGGDASVTLNGRSVSGSLKATGAALSGSLALHEVNAASVVGLKGVDATATALAVLGGIVTSPRVSVSGGHLNVVGSPVGPLTADVSGELRDGRVSALAKVAGSILNGALDLRDGVLKVNLSASSGPIIGSVSGAATMQNANLSVAASIYGQPVTASLKLDGGWATPAFNLHGEASVPASLGLLDSSINLTGRADLERTSVNASGRVAGLDLRAAYSGGQLSVAASGATALTLAGMNVKASGVTVSSTADGLQAHVAALDVNGGSWQGRARGLRASYSLGHQVLSAQAGLEGMFAREALRGTVSSEWRPGWAGRVALNLQGTGVRVTAAGPWSSVNVAAQVDSSTVRRVAGTSGREDASFDLSGSLSLPTLDGAMTVRSGPVGSLKVTRLGAELKLNAEGFNATSLVGTPATVTGQVVGTTTGALNGSLEAVVAGTTVRGEWRGGRFTAVAAPSGLVVGVRGLWPGLWPPGSMEVSAATPVGSASATLDPSHWTLNGALNLDYSTPLFPVSVKQVIPLRVNLVAGSGSLGGLDFASGSWSGALSAPYRVGLQAGVMTLAARGALTDPVLDLQASGPATLSAAGPMGALKGRASVNLSALAANLPATERVDLQAGALSGSFTANLSALSGTASVVVTGARVAGLGVSASGSLVAGGGAWSSNAVVGLGGVESKIAVGSKGLRIDPLNLDLRVLRVLGLDVEGRVTGRVEAKALNLGATTGSVALKGVRVFGQGVSGALSAAGGVASVALKVNSSVGVVSVDGEAWPKASLAVQSGEARVDLSGDWASRLEARVGGALAGQPLSGVVTLTGGGLAGGVHAGAGSLSVSGSLNAVNLSASDVDLSALAGTTLSAGGQGKILNGRVQAELAGSVAGGAWAASVVDDGVALLLGLELRDAFGVSGVVTASGQLTPSLALAGRVQVKPATGGAFGGSLAGTVEVLGPLGAPQAILKATVGDLTLAGTRLNGVAGVEARWSSAAGLSSQVNLPRDGLGLQVGAARLAVTGGLNSNGLALGGGLSAQGVLFGRPLNGALVAVDGGLQLKAALAGGEVSAVVLRDAWRALVDRAGLTRFVQPAGSARPVGAPVTMGLSISRVDVGSLLGAPGLGVLDLSGAANGLLDAPNAALSGTVTLGASVVPLKFDLNAESARVTASGALSGALSVALPGGALTGSLKALDLNLGPLLGLPAVSVGAQIAAGGSVGAPQLALSDGRLVTNTAIGALDAAVSGAWAGAGGRVDLQAALKNGAAAGTTVKGQAALGSDGILQGALSAQIPMSTSIPGVTARIALAGTVGSPSLSGSAELTGIARGAVRFGLTSRAGQPPALDLDGALRVNGVPVTAQLTGEVTRLTGRVEAAMFKLTAANGVFEVTGPGVSGRLQSDQGGVAGSLRVALDLATLSPQVKGRLDGLLNLSVGNGGVKADFDGQANPSVAVAALKPGPVKAALAWTPGQALAGSAALGGGTIVIDGGSLTAHGLTLQAYGLTAAVNGQGNLFAPGGPDVAVIADLSGVASGSVQARWAGGGLSTQLTARSAGLGLQGHLSLSSAGGWSGRVDLSGLPAASPFEPNVVAGPTKTSLTLSGAPNTPRLTGAGQLFGAALSLDASLAPVAVTIRLDDAGSVTAGGAIQLQPDGRLSGGLTYAAGPLSATLNASGDLSAPAVAWTASFGKSTLRGAAALANGQPTAHATLSDGTTSGNLNLSAGVFSMDIPSLNLAAFEAAGVGGRVSASGRFTLASDLLQSPGEAKVSFTNLSTGLRLPELGWIVDGAGSLTYSKNNGLAPTLVATYDGGAGHLDANFKPSISPSGSPWTGAATFNLHGFDTQGAIQGQLNLSAVGLQGQASAKNLLVRAAGITAVLDGEATLNGNALQATGSGAVLGGRVQGSIHAGLTGLWPGARSLLGNAVSAGENDALIVQARFDGIRAEALEPLHTLAPYLTGRAYGVVQASESVTTLAVSAPEASWPDAGTPTGRRTMPVHLNATIAGTDVRADGNFGDSTFTAASSSGIILGQVDLRNAPLHALIGSVTGPLPGSAFVTGLARFSAPMDRPVEGSLRLALVRADLSTPGDGAPVSVHGGGNLSFGRGGLEVDNLRFDGAGSWKMTGRYKPDVVDLKLVMEDASLTPVLSLIPALKDVKPRAHGTATLQLSGRYGAPDFALSVANLTGQVQGQALSIPSLNASLKGSALLVNGAVAAGGGIGGSLGVQARATINRDGVIAIRDVSGLVTGYADIAPAGRFDALVAQLSSNASGGVDLHGTARKGGTINVDGGIYPQVNLRVTGTRIAFLMPSVFVQDSLSNLDLGVSVDDAGVAVSGNITILRLNATLNPPAQATLSTAPAGAPAVADSTSNPTGQAALSRIHFNDVHISAVNGIRIQEGILNTELGGSLTLAGSGDSPTLSGTVEALPRGGGGGRGTLVLGGNTFLLNSGVAVFNPADGAMPVITAHGASDVHTQLTPLGAQAGTLQGVTVRVTLDLTVNFTRAADGGLRVRLDTHLSGAPLEPGFPMLSEQDLYGLVALGANGAGVNLPGLSGNALSTAVNLFVFNEIQRAFTNATGINLQISTNLLDLSESDRTIQAAFTFGGYLSRQLYLEYRINTLGFSAVDLRYTTDDGKFTFRFYSPLQLSLAGGATPLLSGFAPEFSGSFNLSPVTSVTAGVQSSPFNSGLSLRLGFSLRF